jgi:pilus assembly protein CpaF
MALQERTQIQNQLVRHYHDRMLREANLASLIALPPEQLRTRVEAHVGQMINEEGRLITQSERTAIIKAILDETIGFGPLENLLADPFVTEIMVNGPGAIFVERNGMLQHEPKVSFMNEDHVRHIIDRVVAPLGRRIDESSPMVDARLPDGSRVNAVVPPLSLNGPTMTIRRFRKNPFTIEDLIRYGSLTEEMAEFLRGCVIAKQSILVSGGTGSGKTTLLNVLSGFIPPDERVITVEDAAELQFHKVHPHVLRMEARPPNLEGAGEVTIRQLVRNALRMRPNRIVVGEVRGAEALDMLQAMNTGHEGSMTTVHANTTADAFKRLETMVMWAEGASELPLAAIREQLASAIDIVIQQNRVPGGRRKIVSVSEVQGMKRGDIILKDIFVFEQQGMDDQGHAIGDFTPTGVIPKALPRLRRYNVGLDRSKFTPHYLESELGAELFSNPEITEIMINGPETVYVEKGGKLERLHHVRFRDEQHLMSVIKTIVAPLGRRIDEANPTVDARLPDGSRVNIVIDPLSLEGPTLTIRRFRPAAFTGEELVERTAMTKEMLEFLRGCVIAKQNILISGGTGSGKTTLLNVLSSFIPDQERLVTIEDAAELRLAKPHVVRLEARMPDEYGDGRVTIRDLVINALRMRPNRIIVGEVRGAEALDMLQAMNTGHEGSMTTVHANTTADAFKRLETMVMWAEGASELPLTAIREQLASAFNIVIQQNRLPGNQRKIVSVSEVQGIKRGEIILKDIFVFEQQGMDDEGVMLGDFTPTGVIPKVLPRIKRYVSGFDKALFTPHYIESALGAELFKNPEISEIMINGPETVYVEAKGKIVRRDDLKFRDEQHLMNVINTIVAPLGRRIDETSPTVDARLPDGSRVNVIIDPLSLEGPTLTIRRFRPAAYSGQELVERGALSQAMLDFLRGCVIAKLNILISGGTGSGKTTFLNMLSSFIPDHERLVTIEDAAELRLAKSHVVRLEARPADQYGDGQVTIRDLVKNALRMRPDRIIVGEVRGGESLDMLQAMNTGHEGSMTTVHANTPRDAFGRLETMALFAESGLTNHAIREQMVSALNIVVQIGRLVDGSRRCLDISEVCGLQDGMISIKPIFRWEQTGILDGVVQGRHIATGYEPLCLAQIESYGLPVDRRALKQSWPTANS